MTTPDEPHKHGPWGPDRLLKKMLPNHTVMRRFIAGTWVIGALAFYWFASSDGRINNNSQALHDSFCAEIRFLDARSAAVKAQGLTQSYKTAQALIRTMRVYVNCKPGEGELIK